MSSDTVQTLSDFPSPQFPTVFADGVSSLVNSSTIVKFFFSRFEPSFSGDGRSQLQPFAQVVMPLDAFAAMYAFFEAQLNLMLEAGYITQDRLDELRATFQRDAAR